jgi:hypothetical protein
MPDFTPDPVPPSGKPRIGVAWIWVALIIAFAVAAWLYFATKGASAPDQPAPRAALANRTFQA